MIVRCSLFSRGGRRQREKPGGNDSGYPKAPQLADIAEHSRIALDRARKVAALEREPNKLSADEDVRARI
jgi:hypothetical protein